MPCPVNSQCESKSFLDRSQTGCIFFASKEKIRRKKAAPDIGKIFNSPFQISLQGKKNQKKFFAAAIELDTFIEWC